MKRLSVAIAALSLFMAVTAFAGAAAPTPVAAASPQKQNGAVVQSPPAKEWGEIAARLAVIDSTVGRLAQPTKPDRWVLLLPAIFGLVGVLLGGILNLIAQHFGANLRAKAELGGAAVQWQLKQLAELYGPLHALLRQSHTLYRDMNHVLEERDGARFKTFPAAAGDPVYIDNKVFKIRAGADWIPFRTVMHLHEVYGKGYGVEPYFEEIVSIGGQIVKVIHDKAGYARPEELELSEVFGRYLAHYSVLLQLHAALKDPSKKIPVDQWAVFPNEIQGLVNKGFKAISDDLMEWRARAR